MKIKFLAVLILALLPLSGLVGAQQNEDQLFAYDFTKTSIPGDLEVNGAWEVVTEDGENFLRGTADDTWNNFLYFPEGAEWDNYALEADVRITSGSLYFDVRAGETGCDVYEMVIEPAEELLTLYETTMNAAGDQCEIVTTLDQVEEFKFALNTWNKVRLEVSGGDITVLINGKAAATGSDTTYTQGPAQIFIAPESVIDLDNLLVERVGSGTGLGNNNPPATIALENFAGRHQDAVAELESLGVVPSGSRLLFNEDYAYFQGRGSWFTPLAANSPRRNVIIAGEITFQTGTGSDFEMCTLTGRIGTNNRGSAVIYLDVGLDNDGNVWVIDRSIENSDPTTVEVAQLALDYSVPHHVLYTLIGDKMNVFIDGEQVFQDLEVVDRSGTFGVSLIGATSQTRCEARNIWVYHYE